MKIVLASASPRRRELLKNAGLEFEVDVGAVEEVVSGSSPQEAVCSLAEQKCRQVACRRAQDCVIGADTVVVLDGDILGKPAHEQQAVEMLGRLSGREHEVYTGVCICARNKKCVFYEKTTVKFFELSQEQIEEYVKSAEPMDKAGAYGIQGLGCLLVERIEGDYFNVVGLPVAKTVRAVRAMISALSESDG